MKSAAVLLAFTFQTCGPPTAPTPVEEEIAWDCERILTHPIRKTYVDRCENLKTGEIEVREAV